MVFVSRYKKSLFIFRRDYRIVDNLGLIKCCEESDQVIPVFCFDPNQYNKKKNPYYGENSFRFLIESLRDLEGQLAAVDSKLHFLQGNPDTEIAQLASEQQCDAVFFNQDYTPYATERDAKIKDSLEENGIDLIAVSDSYLTTPGSVCTGSGGPYKVFTPFRRKAVEQEVSKPQKFSSNNLIRVRSKHIENKSILDDLGPSGESSRQVGGRTNALEKLSNISEFSNYSADRNTPAIMGTTELSAHLKFGTISIREVYWEIIEKLSGNSQLLTELYWRDFYAHLLHAFPYVLGDEFKDKYQGMEWFGVEGQDDSDLLVAWQQGQTGFPIVDAGMRQLLTEGWMHNRVRMIVASFLVKDLHLDWREGERWFAKNLVDYDPASNNGGWQWAASTGADSVPYFRIFNPWTQQKKFDTNCEYVKKYIPELNKLDNKVIHKLGEQSDEELSLILKNINYPKPIVNHKEEREVALEQYKSLG